MAVSPNGRELPFVANDRDIHQIEMLLVAEIETPAPEGDQPGKGGRKNKGA